MPPSQQPKSLQEILKQRQRSEFVGRGDYLSAFSRNLKLPLDDHHRQFLFNVWGQGGVGKSTLVKQFSKSAQDANAAVAYTDESETSMPEAMGRLAEQFTQQGYKLNQFTERYRLFRQRKQELETDPEAPQGFSAFVGKTVVRAGVKLGRRVPVGGAVLDFVDEETLSTQAGEWAAYVAKKLRNKDEVQLIQEPVAVLTPLFLQDLCTLAQQACVALFFDTYEQTDEFLDPWLRDVLEGKYGDVPSNIVITIAGRNPLDNNHWAAYDGLIARFPLEPFTEDEAKQYLNRKGIINPKVVEVILHLSGRLPLLVATLAVGSPDDPDQVSEPSDSAVEHFLKWVEDPKQHQVALAAALPRKFNRDIIAELTTEDDADALFVWLKTVPFVKEQSDGWVYHQVVRGLMLRYQRLTSPKNWQAAHAKLEQYFDQCRATLVLNDEKRERDPSWQHYSLETLYHSLCAAPQTQLKPAVNGFLAALKNQQSFAVQWAEVMEQAGQDAESQNLNNLAQQLVEGLRAYDNNEYTVTLEMFSKLLSDSVLEPRWRCVALAWRGDTYRLMGSREDALRDLDQALEIEGEYEWAIARRGEIYGTLGRYEEALADCDRAIALKSDYETAFAIRGRIYWVMKRNEEALADLSHAIELEPDDQWAISIRGMIYWVMNRNEEALADLSHAIELEPDDQWTIANRGGTYLQMERYEEALADLTRAIELNPNNEGAIANRGGTYAQMERYEEALADLTRAIELKPDDQWAIILQRGEIYRQMKRYDEALADLTRAIELKPDDKLAIANRGEIYQLMECYENALADLTCAIDLDPTYKLAIANRGKIYQLMERHDEAISDFSRAIELKPDDQWVIALRSVSYQLMERYDEALADLSRAIDLKPDYEWAIASRGETYRQMERYEEALADLSRAIDLKPDYAGTIAYRGVTYRLMERYEEALADLTRAIDNTH